MGVLFIAAMALIFYILLLRAQHLSSMEQRRENPDPEAHVQRLMPVNAPVILHAPSPESEPIPHVLHVSA